MHTTPTSKSHSRGGSHVFHEENARAMQLKIDHLKRRLCHEQRRRTPSNSKVSFGDERDASYRPKSGTPPSESFSCDKDYHHECRYKSPPHKGLGNDDMSRVLNQISRSPFMRRIEGAKLPQRFTQPTFTIYNGRIDPMEHVSHFNQRMAIHSKNEALICKVFPTSLELVAMR